MKVHANVKDGIRAHTARVFLKPAAHRTNLHVMIHAHVTKVGASLLDVIRKTHIPLLITVND